MLSRNKFGQLGETLTWLIATVIIVAVMIFFVFGSSTLGQTKKIGDFRRALFSDVNYVGDDLFLKKSLFTYFLLDEEGDEGRRLILNDLERWGSEDKFYLDLNETKNEISRRGNYK